MSKRAGSVVVSTLAAAALLTAAPAASAASAYCSQTGDFCYSAKKRAGVVRLAFATFSFTGRVKACVTAPTGSKTCRSFLLRSRRGVHSFDVRWSAHFPNAGAGTYRVRFRNFGNVLGPAVTFTR